MKNIFTCIFIIIGTIIGAGFASGQEILSFFNRFGTNGMFGIILACMIIGIVSSVIIILIEKNKINSYEELVKNNKIIIWMMQIFLFICFCIMMTGLITFFTQLFGIPATISKTISFLICILLLLKRFEGIEKVNFVLIPLIILGVIMLLFNDYDKSIIDTNNAIVIPAGFTENWLISAILYASYNLIIAFPVLTNFKKYSLSKGQALLVGMLSAFFLAVMGLVIYFVCQKFYPQILTIEIPTLQIAEFCGKNISVFYSAVIMFAIITTAFSTGYSFLRMRDEKNYVRNAFLICTLALAFSNIGFSKLINTFFPLFGIVGVVQIIGIIVFQIKNGRS
ncbi:MAG: hypothetical protein IJX99_01775 [Clostridia bacterium]|nr:hypothetical protein [Clostridia bacterium]